MIQTAESRDPTGPSPSTSPDPLRVLLVDVSDRGGIARYCAALRAALRSEGASVSLAAPPPLGDAGLSLARRHWGPDVSGLARARLLGRRLAEIVPSALLLGRAVRRARGDVVHVHTDVVPPFDHRALAAVARRSPVVITAHDPEPLAGGARAARRQAKRWRVADAVIVHAEAQRHLVEAGAPGVAVYVVPVDLALGGPPVARAEARRRLGLGENPTALLLGLIRPYKGLDILADAWPRVAATVPGARLVVAGEPFACPDLDRLERLEGVEIRRGFMTEDVVDGLAAAADVLVLPYHRGSHSGILHRGAAAGTPVLASPSLADEVQRTGAGLVVALDPAAWSDALVAALSGHPPPTPSLRTGRVTAQGTLAVYRDVLDRRAHRARRRRRTS